MIVGIVVIVLSIVIVGIVVSLAWRRWRLEGEPDVVIAPVGSTHCAYMHYDDGTARPWEGIEDMLIVLSDYARRMGFDMGTVKFHFIVVPTHGIVRIPHEADNDRRTGAAYTTSFLGLFDRRMNIAVKQFVRDDGGVLPVRNSAFLHEIVQHVWPKIMHDDWGFEKDAMGELVHAKRFRQMRIEVEGEYARYMKERSYDDHDRVHRE